MLFPSKTHIHVDMHLHTFTHDATSFRSDPQRACLLSPLLLHAVLEKLAMQIVKKIKLKV